MKRDGNKQSKLTRRDVLKHGLVAALGAAGAASAAGVSLSAQTSGAASPAAPPPLAPRNHFSRIMQDFLVARVREVSRQADARRAALRTKADAEAYVRDVRARIRASLGPWPEKTPLNERITRTLDRGAYRIENVIFESRPNYPVTANLYVPAAARTQRAPGVVIACGHYNEAKAAEPYQAVAQALARLGYVALIFDPVGQSERLQFFNDKLESTLGFGVDEHLQIGNQQVLVGESLAAWRTWDGIRALDYLLSRPEVDPSRVGLTGNSGGGTDSTWLCAADDRWAMAAPQCFVTTILRNVENELPTDPEQCPPRALALGLDHSDFIAAMAPKPVALLAQEKDFFDARGTEEAHARLQRLYELLGAPENLKLVISPDFHGYSQPSREALYQFFNQWAGLAPVTREPTLTYEKKADLTCTPRGQVNLEGARPAASFTAERAGALARQRRQLAHADLRRAVRDALRMPALDGAPEYRILRPERERGYPLPHAGVYAIETEADIFTLVYGLSPEMRYSRPRGNGRPVLLSVCHHSSDDELRTNRWLAQLIATEKSSSDIYTCDPRGIGESTPDTCNKDFRRPYGCDYFYAANSLMLDRPYVGQKTYDVLRVIQWLRAAGYGPVHLVGTGWGALPATFAALLSDDVTRVSLRHAPVSYAAMAETADYNWPLSVMLPNVLATFDLPDCYRVLVAEKQLVQVEPWDARGAVVS